MNIRFFTSKFINKPSPQNVRDPLVRVHFGARVIHSFLFATIMLSLWDFRKFRNKQDSIFNLFYLNTIHKSILKYLGIY
jgi:hypothetical protein